MEKFSAFDNSIPHHSRPVPLFSTNARSRGSDVEVELVGRASDFHTSKQSSCHNTDLQLTFGFY